MAKKKKKAVKRTTKKKTVKRKAAPKNKKKVQKENTDALLLAVNFADKNTQGHFVLFGFTTNFRCRFGFAQEYTYDAIQGLPVGKTALDAVKSAIKEFESAPAPVREEVLPTVESGNEDMFAEEPEDDFDDESDEGYF